MPHLTDSHATIALLDRLQEGDDSALEELLERHIGLIHQSVQRRLNHRVRARVDPSDVVQETELEVLNRLQDYLARRPMPFRLWVLRTAHERLLKIERQHLGAAKRSIDRELPLPDQSSLQLAARFVAKAPRPEQQAMVAETAGKIRQAMAALSEHDREVLMLRNFENLSNMEVAALLELNPETTKKRYARSLLHLQRGLSRLGVIGVGS